MSGKLHIGNYTEQENLTFNENNLTYYCLLSDYSMECVIIAVDFGICIKEIKNGNSSIMFHVESAFEEPRIKCLYKGEFPNFNFEEYENISDTKLFKSWLNARDLLIKNI